MGTHASFAQLKDILESTRDPTQVNVQNEAEKKRMWAEYMKEAEKYDNRAAESWSKDADGLLVFTGLFSATVGAFIIEFYKKLSADSGDRTAALLCQISQQLPNFTSGTCTPPEADQSFSPSAPIIWANAMWMMSLILSLTSALFATLLQQWARRYVQMPQVPSEPKQRARVRSYLFFGTRRYRMLTAVETAPTLLHISVCLFWAGLVTVFYTIHRTVAIIVSISVGIFVVAYVTLTILPYINHSCPYRTPMSNIWWYSSHITLFSISFCFHRLFRRLHDWLVRPSLGGVDSTIQHILVSGLNNFRRSVEKHRQRLKDGFGGTIVKVHLRPSDDLDLDALTWWLKHPALADESNAQDFLSCLPKKTVAELIRDPDRKLILSEHLLTVLRSCGPGLLAVGLDEKERRTRLLVYLRTIYFIIRDFVNHSFAEQYSDDVINFVRSKFAEISHMQAMWTDSDVGVRVTSRSICALMARCLLRRRLLEASDLAWLKYVIGESSDTIFNSDTTERDLMNLKAFVCGIFAPKGSDLAGEHANSFMETFVILMTPDAEAHSSFDKTKFHERLDKLIERIERDSTSAGTDVVDKLRRMFEGLDG